MTALHSKGSAGLPGRDAALAALAAVVADARAGRRGVVLLTGDAGMGKTSLLRAAFGVVEGTVLWASGAEGEAHVAHGITDQLIRSSPLGRDDREGLRASIGSDALAVGAAMVALVDRLDLGAAGPLIVVVDDAQWADHPSLRALTFAARRLRRDRAALVVACRGDGVDALPEVLVRLVDDEGTRLAVEPLGREDVRLVASEHMGHPVSVAVAERLRAHTGGVPLHLRTLLEELPLDALTADGALPAPRSFNTLVLGRLAGADPAVEAVVMAAAILEDPAPPALLGAVAGVADVLPAVDDAVERGLLTVLPAGRDLEVRLAVAHPLVRAALLGDLSQARKVGLHERAGATLAGLPALRHRLAAATGPDPVLWGDATAAAAREGSHGHAETAALISQLAIRIAPDPEARLLSALDAIDHHLDAGQLDQAAALRGELATASPAPRARYIAGRLAYVLGPRRESGPHLQAAWDELVARAGSEEALADLDPASRRLGGAVAAALAVLAVDRADGEGGVRWARRAIDLDPLEAARGSTAHLLAGASALSGRFDEGLAELERICAAAGDEAGPAAADALSGRGLLRLWCHDLGGAAADFERSLEMGRHGSFVGRETARFYLAEVRYRQGRWDEAVALAETAASVIDDTEQAWMAAIPHATAARPLAARGSTAAVEHLGRAEEAAERVGGVSAVLAEVSALEVAASGQDLKRVVELGDGLAGRPIDERIAPWRATYVEALAVKGRVDDAAGVVEDLGAMPATPLVQADLVRARTALAAAGADLDLDVMVARATELGDAAGRTPPPASSWRSVGRCAERATGEPRLTT